MSSYIVNAAPMVIQHGTQDLSTRQLPREAEAIPQHLPKFYVFAQKGPTTPQLVVGAERINTYGVDTFDLRGKFANHSTVFANLVNAEGNSCMIERVIPDNAGPEANILFWLDVLPTKVDVYKRDFDGSIMLDSIGSPTVLSQTDGYKVKWVTSSINTWAADEFGQAATKPGDQVDPLTDGQSRRYPIFELKGSSQGEYGNNTGIRIWAPTSKNSNALPTKMMAKERAYPINIAMLRRPDAKTTPTVVQTIFGDQGLTVTLKPGTIDPTTDKQMFIGDVLLNSYQNLVDLRYPPLFGDFGSLAIYNDNIGHLLTLFHAAEVPFINETSDFTSNAEDIFLFNMLGGVSSSGVPYHSFQFTDAPNAVRLSQYSNLMAAGGSDGTMTDAAHATLVAQRAQEYLDPNSELMEVATNVESIMYDTGFPLQTKYALIPFIAQRKDTFVALSTHDVNGPIMTAAEEHSMAIALRTRLQMFPESDYFGTPVMRGMIVGRSAILRNSQYTKRLPLLAEIAIKSARYMGAGNGRWKNGSHFDGAPGSIVDSMTDISITWVPAAVRNRNWDVGLNWVQSYDRRSFFFPALKTVYADDTSVLNSYLTAMAICQLNKVAHSAWREFTGVSHLSNAQLVQRTNDFINAKVLNKFDGRFVIVPDAQISDMDLLRGFSWTLPIKLYGDNMKTVMSTYVQAYRMADYATV